MSWPKVPLDELGYVSRGRSRHRPRNDPTLYGGPYPFIQTGDVKRADFRITTHAETYSDAGLAQSRLWPKDTLCITIAANIADTALLDYAACFPDSVIGFIADPERSDPRFVKYYFDIIQRELQMVSQGATQDNLSQEKLLSFGIACPPVETQRKIADVLSNYGDLIATNQRRIALLEDAARRLYREWFVHLRFPGYEAVPVVNGVPQGWRLDTLDKALFLQRGFDLPSGARLHGNVPVYASTGVNGFHNVAKVCGPGVVTGRSGTLGVVHYVPQDFWPLNTALWVKEFRAVSPLFAYFMLSELRLEQFNSGASVPTLDRKVAHLLSVLIPARNVNAEFDLRVQPLFDQIETLMASNDAAARARDLLLPQLMSGQLDVSGVALPEENAI